MVKLLDCTLRDGGFLNNWQFGQDCIVNIIERLNLAKIDIVEIGYLREKTIFDPNATQFPDTKSVNTLISKEIYGRQEIVAILDYGDCGIENIYPATECLLHGIRITFKQNDTSKALALATQIQRLGYKVYLQPVNIMGYTPEQILSVLSQANEINPEAVCIVDTYGFMDKYDLLEKFYLFNSKLNKNIKIGYHSHNNFQLAYSNCVELIEQSRQRDIIVDCSVFGMGKGAGNANTELMALYLNKNHKTQYVIEQILEIADVYIEKQREKHFWGYSLLYYLAAATSTHHSYVKFLLDKKTLSIKSIKQILESLDKDKKHNYDEKYIIDIYKQYQSVVIDDSKDLENLKNILTNTTYILLIGLGASVQTHQTQIKDYITTHKPLVISINHICDFIASDFVFISNAKRYGQISHKQLKAHKFIITSNVTTTTLKADFVINYEKLLIGNYDEFDFGGSMLIKALVTIGIKEVVLAGFDGFNHKKAYANNAYNLTNANNKQNEQILNEQLKILQKDITIQTITPSTYEIPQCPIQ